MLQVCVKPCLTRGTINIGLSRTQGTINIGLLRSVFVTFEGSFRLNLVINNNNTWLSGIIINYNKQYDPIYIRSPWGTTLKEVKTENLLNRSHKKALKLKLSPKSNLGFICECIWVKPLCKSIITTKEALLRQTWGAVHHCTRGLTLFVCLDDGMLEVLLLTWVVQKPSF